MHMSYFNFILFPLCVRTCKSVVGAAESTGDGVKVVNEPGIITTAEPIPREPPRVIASPSSGGGELETPNTIQFHKSINI